MKYKFTLLALMMIVLAHTEELLQPAAIDGELQTYVGYISVERDRLYDIRAKEFNGRYFISENSDGGRRIPIYADWYHITSRIVGIKVKVIGRVRQMKIGDQLQISSLEIVNEK
jgi:hypothetical protein